MTAPEAFDIKEHVLDHAGALYEWLAGAWATDLGYLRIEAADDTAEYLVVADYSTGPTVRDFSADEVWEVILEQNKLAQEVIPGSYTARYYADLVAGNWDDLDGDMNVIDSLLQQLAFGEVVFA